MKRAILALALAAALGLSGCDSQDCADMAAKLPAGMVVDWRQNDAGICQVRVKTMDGTPGGWIDTAPLAGAAEKLGVDR